MGELESFFNENAGGESIVKLRARCISYDPPVSVGEPFERYRVDGNIDLVDGGRCMVFGDLEIEESSRDDSYEYIKGVLTEYKGKHIILSGVDAREKAVSFYSGDSNNLKSTLWVVHCCLPGLG